MVLQNEITVLLIRRNGSFHERAKKAKLLMLICEKNRMHFASVAKRVLSKK
jgi:hypothetical protein